MKRLLIVLACFVLSLPCIAQKADEPASKDDVILLLRTMQSHDTMQRTMEAITKPMRQMYHEQYVKEKDNLPPDFEPRMAKMMEDMLRNMPFDEMLQAMIPAYQKHFTHTDVEALNAFYSSTVGQKFLHETPEVTSDAMESMMPVMTRYINDWQERMKHQFEDPKAPEKNTDIPVQR